jgi:thioredoxin-like negative regulator of GroEL
MLRVEELQPSRCTSQQTIIESFFDSSAVLFRTAVQIDAESVPEVSALYPVKSVPTCVLLADGAVVEVVEGASSAAVAQAVRRLAGGDASSTNSSNSNGTSNSNNSNTSSSAAAANASSAPQPQVPSETKEELHARLQKLVSREPVVLFMKVRNDA